MKILSLFDGISCGRVALERAGIPVEVYYASEIEQKPIEISKKNYPDIIQLGDVKKITKEMVGEIDLICGGSPCQSFSNAGSRTGFEGKSGLFYEFVRLVKEIQPKYFLLENVKMKQEWQDIISEELGVKPVEINSSLVSGQQRKRLYWVGKLVGGIYKQVEIPQPEDRQIFLQDILQNEVDEKYNVNLSERYGLKGYSALDDKSKTLTASMFKGYGNDCVTIVAVNPFSRSIMKDKARCLNTGCGSVTTKNAVALYNQDTQKFRKLTPIECERLQTLPDNYTEGVSNTQRYKAIGNGWTVDVIAHIFKNLTNN